MGLNVARQNTMNICCEDCATTNGVGQSSSQSIRQPGRSFSRPGIFAFVDTLTIKLSAILDSFDSFADLDIDIFIGYI